jgi:hypothetical protein
MFFQLPNYQMPQPDVFFEEKTIVNNYELDDHDKFILSEVQDSLNEYYLELRQENCDEDVTRFFSEDTILEMAELLLKVCGKNG